MNNQGLNYKQKNNRIGISEQVDKYRKILRRKQLSKKKKCHVWKKSEIKTSVKYFNILIYVKYNIF